MKKLIALISLCVAAATAVMAQNSKTTNLTSKMLYHDGPVLNTPNIYFIWYGCWNDNCGTAGDMKTREILTDFVIYVGGTPYMKINSTYPSSTGEAPSGVFIFGGEATDATYSHGYDLTQSDITGIISDLVNSFRLPQDANGIYVVFASADVTSNAMGFCTTSAVSYHGEGIVNGNFVRYIFLGNPVRCPSTAGPQFPRTGPTPNGNYAADVLVSNLAQGLDTSLTNPAGNGWFDRYGFENAEKCQNTFGQTYLTANGARANIQVGGQDYLIQQNWVNDRKPRCAMFR